MSTILPEELLTLVLSNLNPKEDRSTIHAVRSSNKLLCRLATPFLYRTIEVGLATPGNKVDIEATAKDNAVVQELFAIPEYADFVKELKIWQSQGGVLWQRDATKVQSEGTEEEDLEATVREAAKNNGSKDAGVAYILLACKNLEVLQAAMSYPVLGKQVVRVLEHASSLHLQARIAGTPEPNLLRSLREVHLGSWNYEAALQDVLNVLCLPALCHLSMFGVADNRLWSTHNPPKHDGSIRNSNPISLVLDSCMLGGVGMDTLLATCPNARSLTMRWRIGLWNKHFTNEEACDTLRERGRNLEVLHIDSTGEYAFRYFQTAVGTYGSFSSLNAKRLAVPKAFFDHLLELPAEQRSFHAAELLPKGLKELYVLGVEDNEMEEMTAIVGTDALPGLEKSVCVPWFHDSFYDHGGMRHVRHVDYDGIAGFELKTSR
jgi:hypothetical protein